MQYRSPQKEIRLKGQFTALAVLCLLAGFLLTLDNIGVINGVWRLWPVFPLFLGLGGVWFFRNKEGRDIISLGIGTFLILISTFFFFLNYTSWSHMVKLWPAFIGIFGISILISACFAEKKRWFAVSGSFFIFLSTIFFMVFTVDVSLWPLSLMLFGIWLLLLPRRSSCEKKCSDR